MPKCPINDKFQSCTSECALNLSKTPGQSECSIKQIAVSLKELSDKLKK